MYIVLSGNLLADKTPMAEKRVHERETGFSFVIHKKILITPHASEKHKTNALKPLLDAKRSH
jgi:hypothetical protein